MDEIAELLQEYMEVRRGLGGTRQDEWLAAAGGDGPFVSGLFREPVDGEAAIVAFWSSVERRWSLLMVCQHLLTNLWLSVVEPVHVIEWPDEDVLVLSAASRLCSAWADNNSSVNSAMNEGKGGYLAWGPANQRLQATAHTP